MNQTTNKYFSYFRVSTKDQCETGASLEAQQEANRRYANEKRFKILKEFREVQSAAKTGRKLFGVMLKELRRRQDIEGIIFHDVDRSSRSLSDWATIQGLVDEGYRIHFSRENIELDTRGNRLTADIKAAVAVDFIRNIKQETRKGMMKRVEDGYWVFGHVMIGYRSTGHAQKELDPAEAPLVKKCFDLYATDRYTLKTLADEMYRLGLRSRSGKKLIDIKISRMLNNITYTGLLKVKGQIYQGRHPAIVSMELFDKVHQVAKRRYAPDRERHEYKFQHMLLCGLCGHRLRSTKAKKKYKYYWCRQDGCPAGAVDEVKVEQMILDALRSIQFSDEQVEEMVKMAKAARSSAKLALEDKKKTAQLNLDQAKDRLSKLTDLHIDGKIDPDTYEQKRTELTMRVKYSESEIQKLTNLDDGDFTRLEELANLLRDPVHAYSLANNIEKRHLLESMMKNLTITDKQLKFEWQTLFEALTKTKNPSFERETS